MFNMYAAGLCSGVSVFCFTAGDIFGGSINLASVILNIWCAKS